MVEAFRKHETKIETTSRTKGLDSDKVMACLRGDLSLLGFDVEAGKRANEKLRRPVFFGENGLPNLQYEIDAYHGEWRCGLEIEAGRAWQGNAIYRDLVQALIMVDLDHLILAVPNSYKYKSNGKKVVSHSYNKTVAVADALFGHSRVQIPFTLTVIGY
ncbi:hypothetical protein [Ferrovibrio sp.]|uniref:hypothetical protein n=1 Tax=Ferrovibrio sp. TaxID=1917215 RepID=UPI003513C9B1